MCVCVCVCVRERERERLVIVADSVLFRAHGLMYLSVLPTYSTLQLLMLRRTIQAFTLQNLVWEGGRESVCVCVCVYIAPLFQENNCVHTH